MKDKKLNNTISILVIVGIILAGLWVIVIYPLVKFNSNARILKNAGERYYEINKSLLPSEGGISTVSGITLLDKKYVELLQGAYNSGECDFKSSWVKVKKEAGEYKYYVYLKCGLMSSKVDHKGPIINLNGASEIEIERGSEFTDPGIKSVRDNTDGNIDISKVSIKSNLNTSKIGEYTITYSVSDSFLNKTIVTRKINVTQSLIATVENSTDESNIYKGNVNNNYIRFSGQLFRIVGVANDGNVKIVSDEDISQVDYNSVDDWLNNYYYSHLTDESKRHIVTNYKWCSDSATNNEIDTKIDCKVQKNKNNVGLLSINEYNSSLKEGESYLYTNTINWTSTIAGNGKNWTTRSLFFGQNSKYLDYETSYHFNVRPSLVIRKDVKIINGDGTINNPYDIGDFNAGKVGAKINTRYSGEYINYGNMLYRIVEIDGDYTKVISVDALNNIRYQYGNGNVYNPQKNGNIGYVIENTVSSYTKTNLFSKHEIIVPIYENLSSYNGKKENKKFKVKFSAPNIYDMYSSSYYSYWYKNSSKKSINKYLNSDNGTIYYDLDEERLNIMDAYIKYVGYLKKDVVIVRGSGSFKDPYKISR